MDNTIDMAKRDIIDKYFKDNIEMQKVVEEAFRGIGYYKDLLAEWFESNGYSDEAKIWRDMAKTSYSQRLD